MKSYITDLYIKGFQSHDDTHIEFEKGLNVIVGPSGTGKSAIIRALEFVLFNKVPSPNFITKGKTKASVSVVFSNGRKITRKREGKENIYELSIIDSDEDPVILTGFGSSLVRDVIDFHGMKPISIAGDDEIINVRSQHDPAFFLADTPYKKASIIGSIAKTDVIDIAISDVATDIHREKANIKEKKSALADKKNEISKYEDLSVRKNDIDSLNNKIENVEILVNKKTNLDDIKDNISESIMRYCRHSKTLKYKDDIYYSSKVLDRLETKSHTLDDAIETISQMKKIIKRKDDCQRILDVINEDDINRSLSFLSYIKDKNDLVKSIDIHRDEIEMLELKLKRCKNELKYEDDILHGEEILKDSKSVAQKLNNVLDSAKEYHNFYSRMVKGIDFIKTKKENLEDAEDNIKEYIENEKICPLCGSKLELENLVS